MFKELLQVIRRISHASFKLNQAKPFKYLVGNMTAKVTRSDMDNPLDAILVQLGDFGKYQIYVFSLVCFTVILYAQVHVAFVFTAMDLDYRCKIPECDLKTPQYEPSWLKSAVPFKDGVPEKCNMYLYNSTNVNNETCSPANFNQNHTIKCSSFVYKGPEESIVQQYNLQCPNNLWKLAFVGTVNNIGQFFGLFVTGIISDKFGRRVLLVWGNVLCGICGIARAFMPTYEWFLVFEFLEAAMGCGTYICSFVLGIELVGPRRRVIAGTVAMSFYTVGEVLTGLFAWIVKSWRPLSFILYSPTFLAIFYFWLIPESVRWCVSKGKIEEAKATLRKAAKVNRKVLLESALDNLNINEKESHDEKNSIKNVLKSTTLMLRLANCCFCWITCAFLFYGLQLNSVALAGNNYLDFILTAMIEIPGYLSCIYLLDAFGRKKSLCGCYFITAIACVAFIFIPSDTHVFGLIIYLIGKLGSTAAFANMYVYTSEMFPTSIRHTLMGTCSTIGRVGSILAPQTPVLAQIWGHLPLVTFAVMSAISGFLCLLFPETFNTKLPDTIEEAENISKLPKIISIEEEEDEDDDE